MAAFDSQSLLEAWMIDHTEEETITTTTTNHKVQSAIQRHSQKEFEILTPSSLAQQIIWGEGDADE